MDKYCDLYIGRFRRIENWNTVDKHKQYLLKDQYYRSNALLEYLDETVVSLILHLVTLSINGEELTWVLVIDRWQAIYIPVLDGGEASDYPRQRRTL